MPDDGPAVHTRCCAASIILARNATPRPAAASIIAASVPSPTASVRSRSTASFGQPLQRFGLGLRPYDWR